MGALTHVTKEHVEVFPLGAIGDPAASVVLPGVPIGVAAAGLHCDPGVICGRAAGPIVVAMLREFALELFKL